MWESNPPGKLPTPHTGFEDRRAHQNPSTPVQGLTLLSIAFFNTVSSSAKAVLFLFLQIFQLFFSVFLFLFGIFQCFSVHFILVMLNIAIGIFNSFFQKNPPVKYDYYYYFNKRTFLNMNYFVKNK